MHDLSRLSGLTGLELRTAFRRALAHLSAAAASRALPLEGIDPEQLLVSVRAALQEGLFEDLSWLSSPNAARALYELVSALPASDERNLLNQRVVELLANADAPTFVALATSLAQSSRSGFSGARMRSRVSLALSLPMGVDARVDALALALISQPEHARDWVEKPVQGSLPSRRLAARLIERAAREAARRYAQRDDAGLRALESPLIRGAWDRLLADRESLVWRHAACARGLLAAAVPAFADETKRALDPELTPTEWRRGATALTASIAFQPQVSLAAAQRLLGSGIVERDAGVAAAMMTGLARAAEVEPRAAEGLLIPLLRAGGVQAAEAFLELLNEGSAEGFGREAVGFVLSWLREQIAHPAVLADDGALGLAEWLLGRFSGSARSEQALDRLVRAALQGFAEESAGRAVERAKHALVHARALLSRLVVLDLATRAGRLEMVHALQEIDLALLQGSALSDLIALGNEQDGARASLHELFEELSGFLLAQEQLPLEPGPISHPTLRMRRVRTLIHLADADGSYGDDWEEARKPRRLRTARVLLNRARLEPPSPLRRAVLACLARTFDALVREDVFELSDVVLCASLYVSAQADIATLAEASMLPELTQTLDALARLVEKTLLTQDGVGARRDGLEALLGLASRLPAAHSPRVSVLRWSLVRVQLALKLLYDARSLADIADPDAPGSPLADLSEALSALAQLVAGTRRRLNPAAQVLAPVIATHLIALGSALEQSVATRSAEQLGAPLAELEACVSAELPAPFSAAVMRVIAGLKTLPILPPAGISAARGTLKRVTSPGTEERGLPAWLPPNRTLGGFYVLHALGEGGVGSVFVARRYEERDDERAEVFALKVPEYDGDVSHVLSEADFLKMFREEAGALLALPDDQPNLARFVTFDAGVRPKPILVMEHVEGPSLEKLLVRRHMDVGQAFDILEGLAKGLGAMHAAGIAHLDVKPSNVILRDFWNGALVPVLVDFGLSGRRLRPGCGTANYAAPEIWGSQPAGTTSDPRAADIYAFGCLAYELLTGDTLFDAPSDIAIVAAHIGHDGSPPKIQALHRDLGLRGVAAWLSSCLRQKPASRANLAELATQIRFLRGDLEARAWPLTGAAAGPGRPGRKT